MASKSLQSKYEKRQAFASILSESRYVSGKSQEFMAAELGVSRKTIQNWESGISFPDAFVLTEWFEILGINPAPYYNNYFHYEVLNNISSSSDGKELTEALSVIIDGLSLEFKKQLLFFLHGNHGSDPMSVLQLVIAHLHLPMRYRVSTARLVVEDYEISEYTNALVNTEEIPPNMQLLHKAVDLGREAVINNNIGYVNINE